MNFSKAESQFLVGQVQKSPFDFIASTKSSAVTSDMKLEFVIHE